MADLFPAVEPDTNLKESIENWHERVDNLRDNCRDSSIVAPASTNLVSGQLYFNSTGAYVFYGYNGTDWIRVD